MSKKHSITICMPSYRIISVRAAIYLIRAACFCRLIGPESAIRIVNGMARWVVKGAYIK